MLADHLQKHGYSQSKTAPGLLKLATQPIMFSLVVDDFGVMDVRDEHAQHLMSILKENYEISVDWKGEKYISLTIDWNYVQKEVHDSITGYIAKALMQFKHLPSKKPQDSLYPHNPKNMEQ